jgi:hypothetical protein
MKKYVCIYKKISKFKCNKVSVLIILVFIPQPPILEIVPQKKFCGCLIKREKDWNNQNKTPQSVPCSNAIQFQ